MEMGSLYRHFKGGLYRILDVVAHSETTEKMVLYEALYPNALGQVWVRPESMFFENIVFEGISQPRFAKLDVNFKPEVFRHFIPKKTFFFMRHGRTEPNAKELMCGGEWDVPIDDEGIAQATKAAKVIERLHSEIRTVVVSPMLRAQMTAKIACSSISSTHFLLEGLREWKVGDWEGKPWGELPNVFETPVDPPGGETRVDFESRVVKCVHDALTMVVGPTLLVAHGAVGRALFSVLGVDKPWIENCEIFKLSPSAELETISDAKGIPSFKSGKWNLEPVR